ADALVAPRRGLGAVELDLQHHRPRHAVHGEVTGDLPQAAPVLLDPGAAEADRRVLLDVEEVGAAEVLVAAGLAGVHAGGVDDHLDRGVLGLFADGDLAAEVGEAAAYLGDHEVATHELDGRVG